MIISQVRIWPYCWTTNQVGTLSIVTGDGTTWSSVNNATLGFTCTASATYTVPLSQSTLVSSGFSSTPYQYIKFYNMVNEPCGSYSAYYNGEYAGLGCVQIFASGRHLHRRYGFSAPSSAPRCASATRAAPFWRRNMQARLFPAPPTAGRPRRPEATRTETSMVSSSTASRPAIPPCLRHLEVTAAARQALSTWPSSMDMSMSSPRRLWRRVQRRRPGPASIPRWGIQCGAMAAAPVVRIKGESACDSAHAASG